MQWNNSSVHWVWRPRLYLLHRELWSWQRQMVLCCCVGHEAHLLARCCLGRSPIGADGGQQWCKGKGYRSYSDGHMLRNDKQEAAVTCSGLCRSVRDGRPLDTQGIGNLEGLRRGWHDICFQNSHWVHLDSVWELLQADFNSLLYFLVSHCSQPHPNLHCMRRCRSQMYDLALS